jgi:hypothetical protein
MSNRAIAKMLGTSEATVRRAKLYKEPTPEDSEPEEDQPDVVQGPIACIYWHFKPLVDFILPEGNLT